MRAKLLRLSAAASLWAIVGVAGHAQGEELQLSGLVGGGFANLKTPGGDTTDWNGRASANLMITDPGFNVQANIQDERLNYPKSAGGDSLLSYGGDVYWRDYAGVFGANVSTVQFPHAGSTEVTFGGFGEGYVMQSLTLRMKGGLVRGHTDAYYADAGFVAYPFKSIALSADVNYAKIHNGGPTLRDGKFMAEFLPVSDIPVSLTLGYDYEKVSQISDHIDILSVGLKIYFGGAGRDGSLRSRQRNGIATWDGPPDTLKALTF
ncbi:MAG TPA: hypothetical protein VGM17_18065 [Rhizomicrobium sp.]|jgi:hypothetical protein